MEGHAQGHPRPQDPLPAHRCRGHPRRRVHLRARSCSPRRSTRRSTGCSRTSTRTPTRSSARRRPSAATSVPAAAGSTRRSIPEVRRTEGVAEADGNITGLRVGRRQGQRGAEQVGAGPAGARLRVDRVPRPEPVPPRRPGTAPQGAEPRSSSTRRPPRRRSTRSATDVPVITPDGRERVRARRHRGVRRRRRPARRDHASCSPRRPRASVFGRAGQGRRDRGEGRLRRLRGGGRRATSSRRSTGQKNIEVLTGAEITTESQNDVKEQLVVLQHVPARLRRHRAARRLVHHLQHLLDHRRPAQPRDGAAAGDRRQGRAGRSARCCSKPLLVGVVASVARVRRRRPARRGGRRRLLSAIGVDIPTAGITIPPNALDHVVRRRHPRHRRRRGLPGDPRVAHPADRRAPARRRRRVGRVLEAHHRRRRHHAPRDRLRCSRGLFGGATTGSRRSGSARSSSSSASRSSDRRSPVRSARCSAGRSAR